MARILMLCLHFQLLLVTLLSSLILPSSESTEESNNNADSVKVMDVSNSNPNTTSEADRSKKMHIFKKFGSLHTLDLLVRAAAYEEKLHNALKIRRESLLKEMKVITRCYAGYKEAQMRTFAGSKLPVESTFVHQFVNDLVKKRNSVYYKSTKENLKKVLELESEHHNESLRWPNAADLYTSYHAILDTEDIYDFLPEHVFQGLKHDTNFGGYLNSRHCALLGTMALKIGHFFRAVQWLEFTLAYIKEELHGRNINIIAKDFVKSLLLTSIQEQNYRYILQEKSGDISLETMYLFTQPVYLGQSWSERLPFRMPLLNMFGETYGNQSNTLTMYTLCMGHELQPDAVKSQLFCHLDRGRHPYFLLNPLKTEQLSEYPYIVQLYDVLGNDTLDEMYQKRGELYISSVIGVDDVSKTLTARSSATSIPQIDFLYKIQNKSELISGLVFNIKQEGLQTAEYTYGRLYKNHNDPLTAPGRAVDINRSKHLETFGDRLATILFYGDAPTEGGNTAFTQAGIAARPVRGSAVFWYNMFRNGSIRTDVSHTACPVIHGHKTIINQWIRYNSNFQTFKCSLNQLD